MCLVCFLLFCCTLTSLCSHLLQSSDSGISESSEPTDACAGPATRLNVQEVMKLIGVFEPSFSFLLLQLIKLMTTVKRKTRWARIKNYIMGQPLYLEIRSASSASISGGRLHHHILHDAKKKDVSRTAVWTPNCFSNQEKKLSFKSGTEERGCCHLHSLFFTAFLLTSFTNGVVVSGPSDLITIHSKCFRSSAIRLHRKHILMPGVKGW